MADASRYEARNAVSAASSSSGGLLGEEVAGAGDDHALHVIRDDLHVVELTVERIDDGEVSPYLVDELRPGDIFEVRGPIGGHFTWSADEGGPLLLIAGGSGLVPLMSMLRHRGARCAAVQVHLLVSARSAADLLYADELATLEPREGLRSAHGRWS